MMLPGTAALAVTIALFTSQAGAQGFSSTLFGVTASDPSGLFTLVDIDRNTGVHFAVHHFNAGPGSVIGAMTWHPGIQRLIAHARVAGQPSMILLHPGLPEMTVVPISGLPALADIEGIQHDGSADRILVSFDSGGGVGSDQIAEVGLDGVVVNSGGAGASDMDGLGYRSTTGELLGWDPNNPTGQRLFAINGLFTMTPSATTVGSPPSRNDIGDIAIDEFGQIYANGIDFGGFLTALAGDSTYVQIGYYGTVLSVNGIAFATDFRCQENRGSQGPGDAWLSICGAGLQAAQSSLLEITGVPPFAPGLLFVSLPGQPDFSLFGGTFKSIGGYVFDVPVAANDEGRVAFPLDGSSAAFGVILQAIVADLSLSQGFAFTNAVESQFGL